MSVNPEEQMAAAERFIAAARGLRETVGADIPLQQVMILAYLYRHGQSNQVDLARALDLKIAAASRHCKSLSTYYVKAGEKKEQRGQQLILADRNLLATREMIYNLSDRAHGIMEKYLETLTGVE